MAYWTPQVEAAAFHYLETHPGSFREIVLRNSLAHSTALLDRLNEATVSTLSTHYADAPLPYPLSYRGLRSQINVWEAKYNQIMSEFNKPADALLDPMDPDLGLLTRRWVNVLRWNDMYCHALRSLTSHPQWDEEYDMEEEEVEEDVSEESFVHYPRPGKHVTISDVETSVRH